MEYLIRRYIILYKKNMIENVRNENVQNRFRNCDQSIGIYGKFNIQKLATLFH